MGVSKDPGWVIIGGSMYGHREWIQDGLSLEDPV